MPASERTLSRFSTPTDGASGWSSMVWPIPKRLSSKPLSAVLKEIGLYSGATVLGNADLALILDPGSIAMKAGVTMTSEEDAAMAAEERGRRGGKKHGVSAGGGCRAAGGGSVGRCAAHRAVPVSRIEYIGYRPVLNFEGQLLPVEDSGGVLAAVQGPRGADHRGGLPRGQPAGGHRGVARAGCGRGRRPVRSGNQPAGRRE